MKKSKIDSSVMQNLSSCNCSCKSKKGAYPPKDRTDYAPTSNQLTNAYESNDETKGTNPVSDPIAVNNIATSEFDLTEDPNVQQSVNSNGKK